MILLVTLIVSSLRSNFKEALFSFSKFGAAIKNGSCIDDALALMSLTSQHIKLTHMDMVAYNIFSCVYQDVLLTDYHSNKL